MIATKLGCYPSKDVAMGTNFRHFRTFSAAADAIFVMLSLHSFDLLHSSGLVMDSFRIVELLQIWWRFVVRLVMELFRHSICCGHVVYMFLMGSLHNTRFGVCDTRAETSLTSDSRYTTVGGRARIVYDALADEIFTAWRYALCIPATEFFWHAISRKRLEIGIHFRWKEKNRKLRLLSNGTILMTLDDPRTNIPHFYRASLC